MNTTDVHTTRSSETPQPGITDMKFEFVTLPVADVDRAKHFYQSLGTFSDPDGNRWLLQEITTRLPGREWRD